MAEVVSVAALLLVLAAAVIRPFGLPEAVVPAAAVVVAAGAIPLEHAGAEVERLGGVVVFPRTGLSRVCSAAAEPIATRAVG